MTVFYSTLVSTFVISLFARKVEERYKLFGIICAIIVVWLFILVAGLRSNIGDTYFYKHSYELLYKVSFSDLKLKDGFDIFQLILYQISYDPQFMIFITSLVTQGVIVNTLYKYRSYFELEVFMYITCGLFLVSMNGIRQAFVGALLFSSVKLIIKDKFIKYCIIVAILATMHSTCLIMIPLYFVVRKEAWSKSTVIIILVTALAFIFFNELMPAFFDLLGKESTYSVYEESMGKEGAGSSIMRVIVNAVPVVLAYFYKEEIKKKWPESNIFVNMSIVNLIFITFALYNWIFARFQIYFQLYNIVLLPYIIKNCIEKREERDLVYYLFLICYLFFFYYEQVIGGTGLGYVSNYFNL